MKLISVVSGCYNEEDNIEEMVQRIFQIADDNPKYQWEYVVIDNHSSDRSAEILERLAAREPRLKVIFNTRNFGHVRSPYYAFLQASGDAVIALASDLQDPPELITEFIAQWERGAKVVAAIKETTEESALFAFVRRSFYRSVARLADVDLLKNFTGFGLYDREVVEYCRQMEDPYPYFRGMISELGYDVHKIPFRQPSRKRGFSKNNFYTLYDVAMLAFTNHTKVPLRMATMLGFILSVVLFGIGFAYLVVKLVFWQRFPLGMAPVLLGLFFIGAVQLIFIGILGEYIGAIHTRISKRPLVVERKRLNFEKAPATVVAK